MKVRVLSAALAALAPAATATAQAVDLHSSPSIAGSWFYQATATGSDAVFTDAATVRRVTLRCTRAIRTVTLAMASTHNVPMITVSTTDAGRMLPARFDQHASQLSADVPAGDPLLDAIVFSRGRFGLSISGSVPVIVPASPEAARVVEDCRG